MAKTVNILSYYHPLTLETFSFKTSKSAGKGLKNYYIISNKTSVNSGKTT